MILDDGAFDCHDAIKNI